MKTLLFTATELEVKPIFEALSLKSGQSVHVLNEHTTLLIGGVGLVNTAINLFSYLQQNKVERIIQVGIAGSFTHDLKLGSIVEVEQEQLGDLGAEDKGAFLSFQSEVLQNKQLFSLPAVCSISVNTCSGSAKTIQQRLTTFSADIENMEGFSFFQVCQKLRIPCSQVRSISNFIEPRNKDNWELDLAVHNLNQWIIREFKLK